MRGLLFVVVLLVALGIVGEDDYQREIVETRHYCEMVGSGVWPRFKSNVNC